MGTASYEAYDSARPNLAVVAVVVAQNSPLGLLGGCACCSLRMFGTGLGPGGVGAGAGVGAGVGAGARAEGEGFGSPAPAAVFGFAAPTFVPGGGDPPPNKKPKTAGDTETKVSCAVSGSCGDFIISLGKDAAIGDAKAAIAVNKGCPAGFQNLFDPDGESSEPFLSSVSLRSIFGKEEGNWKLYLVLEIATAGSRNHFYLFS